MKKKTSERKLFYDILLERYRSGRVMDTLAGTTLAAIRRSHLPAGKMKKGHKHAGFG
jgi:hypothetical protein